MYHVYRDESADSLVATVLIECISLSKLVCKQAYVHRDIGQTPIVILKG